MKIVFFGDSITECERDKNDESSLGNGYVKILADKLRPIYPDMDIELINKGISGNEVCDLPVFRPVIGFDKEEIVERAKILPPQCLMAAAPESDLKAALDAQADLMKKYDEAVDRESAFEQLEEVAEKQQEQLMKGVSKFAGQILGTFGREATRQITRNLFGGRRR